MNRITNPRQGKIKEVLDDLSETIKKNPLQLWRTDEDGFDESD